MGCCGNNCFLSYSKIKFQYLFSMQQKYLVGRKQREHYAIRPAETSTVPACAGTTSQTYDRGHVTSITRLIG